MFLLSGCGGFNSDPTATDDADVPIKEAVTIKPSEEKQGGNINIYLPKGVSSLNPLYSTSTSMDDVFSLIYEKVVYIDSNNKPQPMIAESWTTEDQGATYTITLRNDVYFSNGAKLTSKDIINSYNYIKNNPTKVSANFTAIISNIASITQIDDTHIKVAGIKSGITTLYALNFPVISISGSSVYGTGPFKVSSFNKDSKLVLVPNTKWWKPQPYLDSITAVCYASEQDALNAFLNGDLDVLDTSSVSSDIYRKTALADRYKIPTTKLNYVILNTTHANVKNKIFRQALAYAINKTKIINNIYISHAEPVDSPIPPSDWRYSTIYTQYNYDSDKAVELLTSLGLTQKEITDSSTGLITYKMMQGSSQVSLKLILLNDTSSTLQLETANSIQSDLADIGIAVTVNQLSSSDFATALSTGNFDLALTSTDLESDMDVSNMISGSLNYGKYSNSTLLSYITNYTSSSDEATILKNVASFQQLFTDEVPFICLNFQTRSLLVSDSIGGISDVYSDNVFNGIGSWYLK